jgi:transposase
LDLGDKYSYLCLIDSQSGGVVEESRLRTTPEVFRRRFDSEGQLKVAIEVGTHSPWVSRLLEECGHEVLVANPRKTRLIYSNKRKTDKLDAQKLARLVRADPELLYPVEHRGEDAQVHRSLIRSREALVRSRTQLINPGYEARLSLSGHVCPGARPGASIKRSAARASLRARRGPQTHSTRDHRLAYREN